MSLHPIPPMPESDFGFSAPHLAYFSARCVPPAIAHQLGARSMTLNEVALVLSRGPSSIPSGGLALPYPQAPEFWRVRMDLTDAGKFLTRAGLPVRPYLAPACLVAPEVWKNTKVELVFVEGPWKAIALCAAGIHAIGLAGCFAGGHDKEKKDAEDKLALHADLLSQVEWKGRKVTIIMDAGRAWNDGVLDGENALARCLLNAGAKVKIAKLPPKGGSPRADQGPDDFLAAQGLKALHQVIDDATKWNPADADDKGQLARLAGELRSMKNDAGSVCLPVRTNGPGKLGWNEMIGVPTIDEGSASVSDADIARLRLYFSERGQSFRVDDVWSMVEVVAQEHPYHPVRRYLEGLKWDGEKRIDRLAVEVLRLKAEDPEQHTLNVAMVRCFLLSGVARAYKPGCKVDTAFILKGGQGSKKSTAFEILASDPWFCDSDLDLGDMQTTPMVMGMSWICEWPELENLKRAREVTQAKAFVSRATDQYRPPYGRAVVSHPRSSIIVGTTNEDTFLTDASGNRRWHVATVEARIDIAKLSEWRDQLWAEAVEAYKSGEEWWLNEEQEQRLIETQEEHFIESPWHAAVCDWLHRNHAVAPSEDRPKARPVPVTVENILECALEKDVRDCRRSDQMAVSEILKRLGWTKKREYIDGDDDAGVPDRARPRAWVWRPPNGWVWEVPKQKGYTGDVPF